MDKDILAEKYGMEFLNIKTGYAANKTQIIVPDGYDKDGNYDYKKDYRILSFIMTKAEYTRVLGERAQQIVNGSIIFIKQTNESDPVEITKLEMKQKKCPLCIVRKRFEDPLIVEIWRVRELIIPFS